MPRDDVPDCTPESSLLTIKQYSAGQMVAQEADELRRTHRSKTATRVREEVCSQSSHLETRLHSFSITAETTDELKELQDDVGIAEETVREMQEELGLSRLHHSRREEFVEELLKQEVDTRVDERLAEIEANTQRVALEHVVSTFEETGDQMVIPIRHNGKFQRPNRESVSEEIAGRVEFDTPVVPLTDTSLESRDSERFEFMIPEKETTATVEHPAGSEQLHFEKGFVKIGSNTIKEIATGWLVDVETQETQGTSADKDALDIEVVETDDGRIARATKLTGDPSFSNRGGKHSLEFRDVDVDREMALIVSSLTTFYKGSIRGSGERGWLVGRDDGTAFAHQVYSTHETIKEAIEFVTPAEVSNARDEGKAVKRQGEMFFVEMSRSSNFDALGRDRDIEEREDGQIVVKHPEYEDLELDAGEWKAVEANSGSQS
jgi:hypothetical protein